MCKCRWCGASLVDARRDAVYCGPVCRKRAFRFRDRMPTVLPPGDGRQITVVYADPPYVDKAWMYEGHQDFAGEVDHEDLINRLEKMRSAGQVDGWALSCSVASLRFLLPMCPEGTKVCAWVKPVPVGRRSQGIVVRWEAVLVVGGRPSTPATADFLSHVPARDESSDLLGRKPPAFCAWLFTLLGLRPGDELQDWFPGTGQVLRAWKEWSTRPLVQEDGKTLSVHLVPGTETSRPDPGETLASPDAGHVSPRGDTSLLEPGLLQAGRVPLVEGTVPLTSGTPTPVGKLEGQL